MNSVTASRHFNTTTTTTFTTTTTITNTIFTTNIPVAIGSTNSFAIATTATSTVAADALWFQSILYCFYLCYFL
jgi:hypothetical protein